MIDRLDRVSWERVCKLLVLLLAGRVFGADVLRWLPAAAGGG